MASQSRPVRVVVADDQRYARSGVALILDSDDGIEVVAEADSGETAVAVVAEERPDIVLMDVRMPGMGGIAATKLITERYPGTRVIVFTTFDLDEYAFGGLQAGASAFLLKSATPEALVGAVKTVAAGAAVVEPRVTSRLIEHYLTSRTSPDNMGAAGTGGARQLDELSPRERDIFVAIVQGSTNAEIAAELHLAQSTVKSHINSIFAKLHLRDRVQAVILGHELGLHPRR